MDGFTVHPASVQAPLAASAYQRWLSEAGDTITTFHRDKGGFLVRFIDRGDFRIDQDGSSVVCTPCPGTSVDTIGFLFANQIRPLLQGHAGELVLHGSAIAADDAAIAFLGNTGRGKSTLAAAFSAAGYPFLTDDGVLLEPAGSGWIARPNAPDIRLYSDSEEAVLGNPAELTESKRRIAASHHLPHQERPLPVRAVYILGAGQCDTLTLEPMTARDAFAAMLEHSFILDTEDRVRLRSHWQRIGDFAGAIPCFALDYPRRYEALPRTIAAILDHARAGVFPS